MCLYTLTIADKPWMALNEVIKNELINPSAAAVKKKTQQNQCFVSSVQCDEKIDDVSWFIGWEIENETR